jgi:hypothetical protein
LNWHQNNDSGALLLFFAFCFGKSKANNIKDKIRKIPEKI